MTLEPYVPALLGGMLIGVSASLLLLLKGPVFGISGILAGALTPKAEGSSWRLAAILGLVAAGVTVQTFAPDLLATESSGSWLRFVIAGLLVGFGTQLGSGCTSGHGVCGISRLSPRSLVATVTFIVVGMLTVAAIRSVGGQL